MLTPLWKPTLVEDRHLIGRKKVIKALSWDFPVEAQPTRTLKTADKRGL